MTYLVELTVGEADGLPLTVGVEIDQVGDGLVEAARPGQVVVRATRSLGEMLTVIRPIAENFVEGCRDMAHAPDQIGVEFGLSLSAKADVFISSAAAQANFKVTLTWDRPPAGEPASHSTEPTP